MRFDIFQHPVGVVRQFKEICFFRDLLDRPAAVGAFAVYKLAFRPVSFAGRTVEAPVFAFIDVAFFINAAEHFLHDAEMPLLCRANEIVVADIEAFPELLKPGDDPIDVFDGSDAFFFRRALNFLPMFVAAGQKKDVVPGKSLEAGDSVGDRRTVRVADVQTGARIVNGRSYIERFFLHKK